MSFSTQLAKGGKNPRPGRVQTEDDNNHYLSIVVAFNETIRIMQEIDEVIEAHRGWPGAFQTAGVSDTEDAGANASVGPERE